METEIVEMETTKDSENGTKRPMFLREHSTALIFSGEDPRRITGARKTDRRVRWEFKMIMARSTRKQRPALLDARGQVCCRG